MFTALFTCYDKNHSTYVKNRFAEDFKTADKIVLLVIAGYCLMLSVGTSWQHGYFKLGLIGGGLVFAICFLAYKTIAGTLMSRAIMAVGLTALMVISIQQTNGLGEGHFIFFLNITILIRYRDILPLAVLIVVTLVHHLLFTYCQAIGYELWGQPLKIFSWGDQTSLGLLAPLIYHLVYAVLGAIVATYYIHEGNTQFLASNRVIGLVEEGAKGDLTQRVITQQSTPLTTTVNGLFERLNQTLSVVNDIAIELSGQAEKSHNQANVGTEQAEKQQQAITSLSTGATQMATTTKEIAHNAETAAKELESTVMLSQEGGAYVTNFERTTAELSHRVKSATDVLSELERGSQQISSIVATIRGISEQTNLLALNAAIEAARAGDQGRGFAVVADEVRSLSQLTHQSTEEISSMISKLQLTAESAVTTMKDCFDMSEDSVQEAGNAALSFNRIADAIQNISDMGMRIATAAEQQSMVTEEISRNAESIHMGANKFLTEAQSASQNAAILKQLSSDLKIKIQQFKLT
ncbi:MAG: methyl-accepting chemotaxis protein [Reinekea sp.]|jgi:methyl-accepting chemotaxis protein